MQAIDTIFSIAILLFSVAVHETAHGYAALYLGDPTARLQGRLSLNPLKHLDPMGSIFLPLFLALAHAPVFGWAKPTPVNPYNLRGGKWGPAIVAAAGPLSNIALAIAFGLCIRFVSLATVLPITALQIASSIIFINIYLAIFNFVPLPPLDGSKVLFALLPYRYGHIQHFLERYGFILLLVFIFFLGAVLDPVAAGIFDFITGI